MTFYWKMCHKNRDFSETRRDKSESLAEFSKNQKLYLIQILMIGKKIHPSWTRKSLEETIKGFNVVYGDIGDDKKSYTDLENKTIGIIGGGRIGLHVARIAKGFGMHVRIYDIHQDDFLAELINFKYISLEELYKTSDIVTLHIPLNKHTQHIINKNSLKFFKSGSILINTSRGALIETKALIEALKNGTLSGVGLDVIEGEELLIEENIFNSPIEKAAKLIVESKQLLDNENVVLTPHNAFNSIEAVNRIIDTTISNLMFS